MTIARTLVAATIASLAAAGCSDRAVADARTRQNVIVVVLDALRADAVSALGCPRPTTPELDRFATDPDSVVFRQHHSTASWTKPSTASLFTGLHSFQHGVVEGNVKKDENGSWAETTTQILADEHVTLGERFRDAGYATLGIVKSRHLTAEYGFAQGFDVWLGPDALEHDAERVAGLLERLAGIARPFFVYLHLSAAHYPYRPDDRDAAYLATHGFAYDEAARRAAGVDFTTADVEPAINQNKLELTPDDVRFLRLIYEATVRKMDAESVAPLLAGIDRAGLADSTLVVFTADHGEELYDHGGYGHGLTVQEEVLHVPLIVRFPRGRRPADLPAQVTSPTSTIDLHATLVKFAGLPPTAGLPAADLFAARGRAFTFAEARQRWALIDGSLKLVHGGKRDRLFDLRTDPDEKKDLAASRADDLARLRTLGETLLATTRHGSAPVIDAKLDPQAIRDLKQLGYIK